MDTSMFVDNAHDSSNKSEDNESENNDISCQDEEFTRFEMNDDEDDEENSEDEDTDNEKCEEDLLLALGEDYSEERNDLPDTSNQANANSSKFHLPFLKKSQDNSSCLPGGLDILNLNAELSKLVVPGTSDNTNANTCLFLNNIYQTLLLENLSKLRQKLAENKEKQKVLLEKIAQTHKNDANKQRKNVFCFPYFHIKGKTPEPNEHTKILQTWHYDKIDRGKAWTNKDHELLIDAIHENAWEMTLKPFLQRLEICSMKMAASEDEEERHEFEQKIEDIKLEMEIAQEQDINEIIKKIDEEKFDWMKISNLVFDGKHSEVCCRLMWKNWLNPQLNKSPWTQTETIKLKELVDLHGRHQWKLIAEELGTNRTPFHCLQHYRRKLDARVKRDWTEEEDKILKEVIETCRIGDTIPWNQVSFFMEDRSADACGRRWSYLNPAIKHGRWTAEEDSLLLAAVNMLGTTNWVHFKNLVPGRTVAQCRERWINSLDPCLKAGPFTYDEDKILLKAVRQHGYNWSLVSSIIPGRTDAACRKQYERLKKWENESKYVSKQSNESKTFFIHNFDVKHFADLVEANETLDKLFPLHPFQNNIETRWKNKQQILKRDLIRQELDRRKGDIFVPRPQLLRKYTNNTLLKQWENRNKMRQSIEEFIQKQMIKNKVKSPKKGKAGYTIVSPSLDNLKPNTSVTEMLKMARCISNQPVEKVVQNKKHLCSDVDKRIQNLLYLDWLKEDMKDQPKLTNNKSKANCEEEKYLDKLEGMTLIMTVLGMDRKNIANKVLHGSSSGALQSTSYLTAEELRNFKEEFLLISQDPLYNGNFSGKKTPKVEFADNVPPNIHTLAAFRLLILERQKLQQSADFLPSFHRKTNTNPDESNKAFIPLSEKMKTIKNSYWYKMLQVHFHSLFMWPALLSTFNGVQRKLGTSRPYSNRKSKKSKYPLISGQQKFRKKRKIHHQTDGVCHSSNNQNDPIPKPSEESNSSEITTTATVAQAPVEQTQRKRGKGRPLGSLTKHKKVYDDVPQRTSSRQREKKARLDSELSARQQTQTSTTTKSKQTPSSSTNSQELQMTELGNEASAKAKDLLANVSPNLVQQVISQEVQVKPVGTYITVPLKVENRDMPIWN